MHTPETVAKQFVDLEDTVKMDIVYDDFDCVSLSYNVQI